MAVLLSFLLAPLVTRVGRTGVGRVPAVLTIVLLAFLAIAGLGVVVGSQVSNLAENIPTYERNLKEKIRVLKSASAGEGVVNRASTMLRDLNREFSTDPDDVGPGPNDVEGRGQAARPIPVEVREPEPSPLDTLATVVGPIVAPIGTAGLVLVFVIFILLQREDLRDRLIRLAGAGDLHRTTQALDDAARRVSRYLLMQLTLNALYGLTIGVGLYLIHVPNPVLWGLLAAILRFIPYAGPWIAAAFPIGLSFAVAPGWTMPLMTVGLFLVIELLSNNVLEPWLYGSSTGISSIAIILAAIFWTSLWGLVGLLLATPLTVCLVVLGRHIPHLQFLSVALGSDPVLPLEAKFYQRMLAGDPEEAIEVTESFLEEHSVAELYDSVVIRALALGEQDRQRGVLDEQGQQAIANNVIDVVEFFGEQEELSLEPATASPSHGSESFQGDAARSSTAVLCMATRTPLDWAAATMLAQLLRKRSIQARVTTPDALAKANLARLDPDAVQLVCMSFMDGSATLQARHFCKRFRRQVGGGIKIMVCFWDAPSDRTRSEEVLSTTTADLLATSFHGALSQVEEALEELLPTSMVPPPLPENEKARLAELHRLELLDTEPEEAFDRVTRRLAELFSVPISLMTLVDETRQFWKASVGLPEDLCSLRQSPRETSICGHVVAGSDVLVIEDVRKDKRFAGNPFLKERGIRFYAGAPLTTVDGHTIGSVCIIDRKPRKLSEREVGLLRLITDGLMNELELRDISRAARKELEGLERWNLDRSRDWELARAVQIAQVPQEQVRQSAYLLSHSYEPRTDVHRTLAHVYSSGDGTLVLLIAEPSGEGTTNALLGVLVKAVFSRVVQTETDPAAVLSALDAELAPLARNGDRTTALVATFDPASRTFQFASAGHPVPILLRNGAAEAFQPPKEPPLMVEPGHRYGRFGERLEVEDRVLLYSDGALDVARSDGSFLGSEGLAELVRRCGHHHGMPFLQHLFSAMKESAEDDLREDVAFLLLECCGNETPARQDSSESRAEADAASELRTSAPDPRSSSHR